MIGLILAAAYVGWMYLTAGVLEPAFLDAAAFLYSWYWLWTAVLGVIVGVIALAVTFGVAAMGSRAGFLGGVGGFLLGGATSVWMFLVFAARSALLIVGAYLLAHAGKAGQTFAQFDTKSLIIGSVLLGIAVIVCRGGASASTSNS